MRSTESAGRPAPLTSVLPPDGSGAGPVVTLADPARVRGGAGGAASVSPNEEAVASAGAPAAPQTGQAVGSAPSHEWPAGQR